MKNVARLSRSEREELFIVTAREVNLPEAMVEKDFWVCWTLDYLFHESPWKKNFAFKGGTSLSKCYDLIDRFSEDIDLILDWRLLDCAKKDPWAERSKNQQSKLNEAMNAETAAFLKNVLMPKLEQDFAGLLEDAFRLYIDEKDPQTVCFEYPRSFEDTAILPMVRLEIGALAAWTPTKVSRIQSYAAKQYPQVFTQPDTDILTVLPERTFWEKVTILHKEAFRTNGNFPARYSRHYYDLCCMERSDVKGKAYADQELLERVVLFKARFYPAGNAHYDEAKPGTMRLMPPEDCMKQLRDDYDHMRNMIYGFRPEFDEVMACMQRLEREINDLRE